MEEGREGRRKSNVTNSKIILVLINGYCYLREEEVFSNSILGVREGEREGYVQVKRERERERERERDTERERERDTHRERESKIKTLKG